MSVKVARFVVDVGSGRGFADVGSGRGFADVGSGRGSADVGAGDRVRVARAVGGESITPDRTMRRVNGLPMPAEPVAAGEPHHAACADATGAAAAELHGRVASRDLDRGDVERYGRWLFDALLGETTFAAIRAAAEAEGAALAEIALRWPASELWLSRLHWEAMRSRQGFLAAGKGLRVAVTRLVAGARDAPRPMASPPRTLFVLGGAAGERSLRPGAELVAVLRPLRHGERSLRGEVVAPATPSRVRAAVKRLSPDLVHLVAHGVVERGSCALELAAEEGEAAGLYTADQLLVMLRAGGEPPRLLVLSACDAGLALPLAQAGSFAARLVEGGVPVVVGMAGRVADVACRLFVRRFGEALLAGEAIVAATEEGRRAAFSDGDPPDRAVDWALPALFLSEGVPPDFGTLAAPDDPIEARVAAYKVAATPVFCGRHDMLEAFHDTIAKPLHPVLAIWSKAPDLGRTRALKELTAEALRSGHVPCLLTWESPTAVVPTTIDALARQLGLTIRRVRAVFGLPPRAASPLELLLTRPLDALRAGLELPASLRDHLALAEALDARAFALALADELTALARDARAATPSLPEASRAIVLVDDVHRWDKALEPFLDELVSPFGLGTKDEPVPVVLSFSLDAPAGALLRPVAERRRPGWMTAELAAFAEGEDLLAYEQVLLHPFSDVVPRFSERRWVFDFDVDPGVVKDSVEAFQDVIAGAPGELGTRAFYALARGLSGNRGFVAPAGDEDVLARIRKGGPT